MMPIDLSKELMSLDFSKSDAKIKAKFHKPSKYRNIKTVVDGIEFDSRKEANYYGVLKMRKMAGEITKIETQVKFSIDIDGIHICNYYADFRTWHKHPNNILGLDVPFEVIDVKGVKTTVYQLKKKLMLAVWGIDIIEK